jgi:hypothetical protein
MKAGFAPRSASQSPLLKLFEALYLLLSPASTKTGGTLPPALCAASSQLNSLPVVNAPRLRDDYGRPLHGFS